MLEEREAADTALVIWDGEKPVAEHGEPRQFAFVMSADALPRMFWAYLLVRQPDSEPPTETEVQSFVHESAAVPVNAGPQFLTGEEFLAALISERHVRQMGIDPVAYLREKLNAFDTDVVRSKEEIQKFQAAVDLARESLTTQNPTVVELLRSYNLEFDRFRGDIRTRLQTDLDRLNSNPPQFGSADEKKVFASLLTQLLNRLGLRLTCQRAGCARPAILRGGRYGDAKHGLFQFQHTVKGRRTSHCGSPALPRLELTLAPERMSRKIMSDK